MFSNEAVDPRRDDGQRYRTELEHSIVESADVEFETLSFPNSLVATLATLPSISLFPKAHFGLSVYNPSMSFATPHEVGSIRGHAGSVNSKTARQFHCSTQEAEVVVS